MKRLIYTIGIIILLFAGIGVLYSRMQPPCTEPIEYSIGSFDPRFGISESDFIKDAEAAADVWDKTTGRTLFEYSSSSPFKINLIYDSRQERTDEYENIQDQLKNSEDNYNAISNEYDTLKQEYSQKLAAYTASSSKLNADLKAYNDEVDSWNQKGGAPEDEYDKLQAEKADLDARAASLDTDRQALNSLGDRINQLSDEGSDLVNNYNDTVSTYDEEFGTSTVFDQGEYNGKEINIYQFRGTADLELVLAHEFGHALGMQHVSNPKSIMYYLMQDQNLNDIEPSAQDIAELDSVCKIK